MHKFETAMNSDLLKQRLLEFTTVHGRQFEDNSGLTNQQVYEKLIAGSEAYQPEINFRADFF